MAYKNEDTWYFSGLLLKEFPFYSVKGFSFLHSLNKLCLPMSTSLILLELWTRIHVLLRVLGLIGPALLAFSTSLVNCEDANGQPDKEICRAAKWNERGWSKASCFPLAHHPLRTLMFSTSGKLTEPHVWKFLYRVSLREYEWLNYWVWEWAQYLVTLPSWKIVGAEEDKLEVSIS